MQMNLKRAISIVSIISIVLLLLIVTAALTSCGNSKTDDSDDVKQTTDQNQPPSEEQAAQPEFTPVEGADYGGYKFRILGYDGADKGLWQIMHISEIIAEEEIGEPIHDAVYRRNREIEALYNVEIACVVTTCYPEDFVPKFTKAVAAGDDTFDAAFLRGANLPVLSTKNMACDLYTIPSLQLSKSWWDQNSVGAMSIGGKLSAVISDANLYSAIAPIVVFANKKLITDNDIGDVYKLVRDGKWTWDVMYDIAKSAAKDLDGDGVITKDDQLGLVMQHLLLQAGINSAGEYITPKNEEDIPVFAPNIAKIAGMAEKLVAFFSDKTVTVSAESMTGYSNQFYDFILPKYCNNQILFFVNQLLFSFNLRDMEADFAVLPLPKYDENQDKYGSVTASWWGTYTVIPITCTDTGRTANILDAMGYYAQKYVMPAYYDRTVTNKLLRDDDSAEMMDIIMKNRVFDLAELYNWGNINGILAGISNSGKSDTVVSQLEKIESKVNSDIQKTLATLQKN
ncbi:MAG: hypothetical protein FWD23_12610 [Oscillospiraceae bacterium]|nr:hypothetical protein [Oscillospiraceae bacterium]